MWRVVLTPTVLFDLHNILEQSNFEILLTVMIGPEVYEGISVSEIALLPRDQRDRISSVAIHASSEYALINIHFSHTAPAEISAVGDDNQLLIPILMSLNNKLDELPSFWSIADTFLSATLWVGVLSLLSLFAPLVVDEAIAGVFMAGSLVLSIALMAGTSIAWDVGPMCRFAWVGDVRKKKSMIPPRWQRYAKYFAIALWTIAAAVVAQLIGTFLWERVLR